MLKSELNQNEIEALRRLGGEPSVQSSDFQSSSLLSSFGEASSSMPIPDTPDNGLLVKISHCGACYSEGKSRRNRFTPQFPGNEIAGTIHKVGSGLTNSNFRAGDRVLIAPNEVDSDSGYAEYIPMKDQSNVLQVPNNMSLEVAAMLPGQALTAFAALSCAKPHVEKLRKVKSCVNVLVVGGSGLGLWTLRIAKYLMGNDCNNVRMFVADYSIDRLLTAQDHGCYDIIHWNEEDHEQYIVERTLDSCRGGVDVIIDYVSSNRSMQRSLNVLNREGLIVVGGNLSPETSVPLTFAAKQQSITGVPQGNLNQLTELIRAVKEGQLEVPEYKVFPIQDANQVFEDLCECRFTGRAVFKMDSLASVLDNQ